VKISFELRVSCSQMDAYVACCVVDLLRDGFSSAVRSVAISDGCEFVCCLVIPVKWVVRVVIDSGSS